MSSARITPATPRRIRRRRMLATGLLVSAAVTVGTAEAATSYSLTQPGEAVFAGGPSSDDAGEDRFSDRSSGLHVGAIVGSTVDAIRAGHGHPPVVLDLLGPLPADEHATGADRADASDGDPIDLEVPSDHPAPADVVPLAPADLLPADLPPSPTETVTGIVGSVGVAADVPTPATPAPLGDLVDDCVPAEAGIVRDLSSPPLSGATQCETTVSDRGTLRGAASVPTTPAVPTVRPLAGEL